MSQIRYVKLPTTLYKVRVPKIALYSPEELEHFGMPVSIINQGERIQKYSNEESVCYLNIEQMVEVFRKGYRIELLDEKDLLEIYKALETFLRDTQYTYIENLNRRGFGVENDYLADIDRFAAEIFGLNRFEIVDKTINEPLKKWEFMPLPDFTGTVTKKNNSVNFARPSGVTMSNFTNLNMTQQEHPIGPMQPNSFPYNPRVANEPQQQIPQQQTGYLARYGNVTGPVPNQEQYTDYYHSNMPNVDPRKVKRNSYNTYSSLFNSKGQQ